MLLFTQGREEKQSEETCNENAKVRGSKHPKVHAGEMGGLTCGSLNVLQALSHLHARKSPKGNIRVAGYCQGCNWHRLWRSILHPRHVILPWEEESSTGR